MKLTVTQFVSLDGVSQAPGAPDEDTSGGFTRGGWFVPHMDERFLELALAWLAEADALLFGRRTYDNFSRDWPEIGAANPADPFAGTMNSIPKYVASHSLRTADRWQPTTILSGDIPAQVAELKQRPGREIQIHGSARLAQSMLAAGLVDTLRLVIAPVVVGTGRRLFPDGGAPVGLRLTSGETTPRGLAIHVYDTTGRPEYGTYQSGT
ncbi:dihydrofolate reductase family protein [Goodfellowiella coeruleoviolacea]|uniref:Dihydrofolate reductase n=1 Tax=Goodfellowiella coeruleoviolacea TaxID=334858 RepID=A0AAE3GC27_9PSEU|nr:dihydrofolate reductase family protein [Goodfellowiella coeruleoviolacea]MCP2164649.1 Dihydrofolate reductase [Goodfellowiella coeruleoviolacea]